jgi:uncharacterized protein YndB with AHSA1/START domain
LSEGAPTAVVQRVIGAPPEVVYDEWLDEAALLEFMAPEDSPAREVECDPRVGGRLRIVLVGEDSVVQTSGEYLELDRPNRLSFSWNGEYGGGFSSVVTVTLEPHGSEETLMTIEHTRLPHDEVRPHENGWARIARHLDERLRA